MNEKLLNKYYNNLLEAMDQLISAKKYHAARQFIQEFNEPFIRDYFLVEINIRENIDIVADNKEILSTQEDGNINNNQEEEKPLFQKLTDLFSYHPADKKAWHPVVSEQDHLIRSYLYLRTFGLIDRFIEKALPKKSNIWVSNENDFLKTTRPNVPWRWQGKQKNLPTRENHKTITKEIAFLKQQGFKVSEKLFEKPPAQVESIPPAASIPPSVEEKTIHIESIGTNTSEIENKVKNGVSAIKSALKSNHPVSITSAAQGIENTYTRVQFEKNFNQQVVLEKKVELLNNAYKRLLKSEKVVIEIAGGKNSKVPGGPTSLPAYALRNNRHKMEFSLSVWNETDAYLKEKHLLIKEKESKVTENQFFVFKEDDFITFTKLAENSPGVSGMLETEKERQKAYSQELKEAANEVEKHPEQKKYKKAELFSRFSRFFLNEKVEEDPKDSRLMAKYLRFLYEKGPRQKIYASTLFEFFSHDLSLKELLPKVNVLYIFRLAELGYTGTCAELDILQKPYSEDSILLVLSEILKKDQNLGLEGLIIPEPENKFQSSMTSQTRYQQVLSAISNADANDQEKKTAITSLREFRNKELIGNGRKGEWSEDGIYTNLINKEVELTTGSQFRLT